jgi:hypothetical protein
MNFAAATRDRKQKFLSGDPEEKGEDASNRHRTSHF